MPGRSVRIKVPKALTTNPHWLLRCGNDTNTEHRQAIVTTGHQQQYEARSVVSANRRYIYFGAAIARESLSLSDSGIIAQLGDCCARCHLKSFTSPQALVTASSSKPAAYGFVHSGERDKTKSIRRQYVRMENKRFEVCVCFEPVKSKPANRQFGCM